MTFLTEDNKDAYSVSPDTASTGPLVGFFDSFNTSVEVQMRTSAQFGIEYFMQGLDWEQTKGMLDAGIENPPQLMTTLEGGSGGAESLAQIMRKDSGYYEDFVPERSAEYLNVAKKYAGEGASPEFDARLHEYDNQVRELRKTHPQLVLRTSEDMFNTVREKAQAVEQKQSTDRRTWAGIAGDFLGGAVASLHPGTDPLNFYTLGVGGLGKTALQRVAFQTGAQGVVEGINQATGVQEERELLGLSHGFADAAQRVGATALGAGALQGVGELAVAGAKRWFRNTPEDASPPVSVTENPKEPLALPTPDKFKEEAQVALLEQNPRSYLDMLADRAPLSGIRAGRKWAVADVADVTRQLEEWGGGTPVTLRPRTETAGFAGAAPATLDPAPAVGNASVNAKARELDPVTFRKYDALLERKASYTRWIDELDKDRNANIDSTMDVMSRRVHALEARLQTSQGKNAKSKIRAELRDVKADQKSLLDTSRTSETPDVAEVRSQLMKTDERMRDLAPLVSRAKKRAQGEWASTVEDLDEVWRGFRKGDVDAGGGTDVRPPTYEEAMSLFDRAPVLRNADKVEPGATSADTARAIVAENDKVIEEAMVAYREEVKRIVGVTTEGKLRIEGREYEFDLDKDTMFVAHEDGNGGKEVTLREYLGDTKRTEDELEAVSTCSIR